MDLRGKKTPIRYCKLQARLPLLVWKEWYSSSGERSCHERRMLGTRPSFYGNKRNLKEELGGGKRGDERERRGGCIGMFLEKRDHERRHVKTLRIRGFPCGNQLYLFINHMHGTTALVDAVRGSFHIQTTYQSICRVDMAQTCSCLPSELLCSAL